MRRARAIVAAWRLSVGLPAGRRGKGQTVVACGGDIGRAGSMVGRIIQSLDCVAEGAAWLAAREPRLCPGAGRWSAPLPLRREADGFAALLRAIVGQQVSVAVGAGDLGAAGGGGADRGGGDGGGDGRGVCGRRGCRGRRRAMGGRWRRRGSISTRLRGAAGCRGGGARWWRCRGSGVWTAEIYAMFALGRADVFAPGDLALQEAARMLFGLEARPIGQGAAGDGRGLVALAGGCGAGALGLLPGGKGTGRGRRDAGVAVRAEGAGDGRGAALVVFLHGYGADGADLLGLADVLAPHLPGAAFVAPDAPERCVGGRFGFQWFPIPWLDGSPQAAAEAGLDAAAEDLNGFLDARLAEEGLAPERAGAGRVQPGRDDEPACRPAPARSRWRGWWRSRGGCLRPERLAAEARGEAAGAADPWRSGPGGAVRRHGHGGRCAGGGGVRRPMAM